ncbi:Uncharacterised protein [Enterobacter cloacae]|nr:Uncharacterised protein [Enterobacter cloacae]
MKWCGFCRGSRQAHYPSDHGSEHLLAHSHRVSPVIRDFRKGRCWHDSCSDISQLRSTIPTGTIYRGVNNLRRQHQPAFRPFLRAGCYITNRAYRCRQFHQLSSTIDYRKICRTVHTIRRQNYRAFRILFSAGRFRPGRIERCRHPRQISSPFPAGDIGGPVYDLWAILTHDAELAARNGTAAIVQQNPSAGIRQAAAPLYRLCLPWLVAAA